MTLSSAILFTLLYGDIFQYPYTEDEMRAWLPKHVWQKKHVHANLIALLKRKKVSYRTPFYCLHGHNKNISLRQKREQYAGQKWKKALFAASILQKIPTILLIGITGGLALRNTDTEDDIDLYIGVKSHTAWVSRFMATILMELSGMRRRPEATRVKDTICLNMFVSEDSFAVPLSERDIFTAHEVLQMRPLWERGQTYVKFLKKNAWVRPVFPCKWREMMKRYKTRLLCCHPDPAQAGEGPRMDSSLSLRMTNTIESAIIEFFKLLEKPVKIFQLWYMKGKRTSEVVSDTVIRFHPVDARLWVQTKLRVKMKEHHLPLDKNFFQP